MSATAAIGQGPRAAVAGNPQAGPNPQHMEMYADKCMTAELQFLFEHHKFSDERIHSAYERALVGSLALTPLTWPYVGHPNSPNMMRPHAWLMRAADTIREMNPQYFKKAGVKELADFIRAQKVTQACKVFTARNTHYEFIAKKREDLAWKNYQNAQQQLKITPESSASSPT